MNIGYGFIILGIMYLLYVITTLGYRGFMYDFEVINMNSSFDMKDFRNIDFKTGDLILFRYDCSQSTTAEYYNHILTLRPWPYLFSHIGMVIKDGDDLYIAHRTFCDVLDQQGECLVNKSGLYPLWDYIDNYRGDVYYSRSRNYPLDFYEGGDIFYTKLGKFIQTFDIIKKIDQLNQLEFKVDNITVLDYLNRTDIANRKNRTITCSGYVHELLRYFNDDIENPKNTRNPNHTTPAQVFWDVYQDDLYDKPIIIINKYKLGK